jgi:DNA-binding response OmpR family regulator
VRILLIEDNPQLNDSLRLSLARAGYAVDSAFDGPQGEELAFLAPYDAIILDIMLPGKDGLAMCRELRRRKLTVPVLMLTARDTIDDRVTGLDSGADDYLVKPFATRELLARLRALLRRDAEEKSGLLQVADLTLDPATRRVERAGRQIALSAREFTLLEFFMRHPDRVVSRAAVQDHLWSFETASNANTIDVYVRRLRLKLDDPFPLKLIETVRGVGYRLCPRGIAPEGHAAGGEEA